MKVVAWSINRLALHEVVTWSINGLGLHEGCGIVYKGTGSA